MFSVRGKIFRDESVANAFAMLYGGTVKRIDSLEADYPFCEEVPIIFKRDDEEYGGYFNPRTREEFIKTFINTMRSDELKLFIKAWNKARSALEDEYKNNISEGNDFLTKIASDKTITGDEIDLALEIIGWMFGDNLYIARNCTYRGNEDNWCCYQKLSEVVNEYVIDENYHPEFVECEPMNDVAHYLMDAWFEELFDVRTLMEEDN